VVTANEGFVRGAEQPPAMRMVREAAMRDRMVRMVQAVRGLGANNA
jgi:hypothetical protein